MKKQTTQLQRLALIFELYMSKVGSMSFNSEIKYQGADETASMRRMICALAVHVLATQNVFFSR